MEDKLNTYISECNDLNEIRLTSDFRIYFTDDFTPPYPDNLFFLDQLVTLPSQSFDAAKCINLGNPN